MGHVFSGPSSVDRQPVPWGLKIVVIWVASDLSNSTKITTNTETVMLSFVDKRPVPSGLNIVVAPSCQLLAPSTQFPVTSYYIVTSSQLLVDRH